MYDILADLVIFVEILQRSRSNLVAARFLRNWDSLFRRLGLRRRFVRRFYTWGIAVVRLP